MEAENANDLIKELKVLLMAQYFLDTFKKCAISWDYQSLPSMYLYVVIFQMLNSDLIGIEFHASGAFVGTLTKDVELPPSTDGEIDNRSLIYSTFLAAPLLPFGKPGYVEDKWSGTNQTGNNDSAISCVLAAFAHHSVVDSNKTCLLVDLQGLVGPDGVITLIDPQAHICVVLFFNIDIVTDREFPGHGPEVLVTLTMDYLALSSFSKNMLVTISVKLLVSRNTHRRKAFTVNVCIYSY